MPNIYIVQHCQSEHHVNDLTGGWTDTPLTELGIKQANLVSKELRKLGLTDFQLFSSDLKRAYMTAEIISAEFNIKINVDKNLREHNNGDAQGKTREWAKLHKTDLTPSQAIDNPIWNNAETFRELFNRMDSFLNKNLLEFDKDIVIVSHGVAIGYLIMSWLGLKAEDISRTLIQGYAGGISILKRTVYGQNFLVKFNSTDHLS